MTRSLEQNGLGDLKRNYYDTLYSQAQEVVEKLINNSGWYATDSVNFPWYWNSTGIFNIETWNWLNRVFSYNKNSNYIETNNASLITELYNTYMQIAYKLSDGDTSKLNDDMNKNIGILNTVVSEYTTMFGPLPKECDSPGKKMEYISGTILKWSSQNNLTLNELKNSIDPMSKLDKAPFGTEKIINDYMSYLNATASTLDIQNAVATYNSELKQCKKNLYPIPKEVADGWMKTIDSNGNSTIVPFLTIDKSTAEIQNDLFYGNTSFSIEMNVEKIDKETVNISASGQAKARGAIDWFTFGAGLSTEYNMFSIDESLTECNIKVVYKGLTCVKPVLSQSAYQISSGIGWWYPTAIKNAVNNKPGASGFQFLPPVPQYDYKSKGTFGVGSNVIISQVPTFTLTFKSSKKEAFDKFFKESSSWSVGIFGIPLVEGKQSYYNSEYHMNAAAGTITVTMAPPNNVIPVNPLDQLAYVIGVQIEWPGGSSLNSNDEKLFVSPKSLDDELDIDPIKFSNKNNGWSM